MAETTKINDIASQLATASRLVVSTDFFWVYMANGQQVKIPAEFVRAYLTDGITPSVNSKGNWEVNGTDTGVKAEGVSPQLKATDKGISVSIDKGVTWQTLVLYEDMDIDMKDLIETYQNIINSEQGRVDAEKERATAESARVEAEASRVAAEKSRESTAKVTKEACDTATQNATQATAASKEQTETAKGYNEHPPKVGDNGNWWTWNGTQYVDTTVPSRGDTLYPTLSHEGNKLYITDTGGTVSQYVKQEGNKLVFDIYS